VRSQDKSYFGDLVKLIRPFQRIIGDEGAPSRQLEDQGRWKLRHRMDATANHCRTKGNEHFNKAEYYLAIE
jgi:hypothetical protein